MTGDGVTLDILLDADEHDWRHLISDPIDVIKLKRVVKASFIFPIFVSLYRGRTQSEFLKEGMTPFPPSPIYKSSFVVTLAMISYT